MACLKVKIEENNSFSCVVCSSFALRSSTSYKRSEVKWPNNTVPSSDHSKVLEWMLGMGTRAVTPADVRNGRDSKESRSVVSFACLLNRYENDRMSNSGGGRRYRDQGYQQQYDENHDENYSRRANNYPAGNGTRGRRGNGSYRGGTQSDAGTGGKTPVFSLSSSIQEHFSRRNNVSRVYLHRWSERMRWPTGHVRASQSCDAKTARLVSSGRQWTTARGWLQYRQHNLYRHFAARYRR